MTAKAASYLSCGCDRTLVEYNKEPPADTQFIIEFNYSLYGSR